MNQTPPLRRRARSAAAAVLTAALAAFQLMTAPTMAIAAHPSPSSSPTAAARAVPAGSLTVPRLGDGSLPIEAVRTAGGAIDIPDDAGKLGWWRGSVPYKANRGSSIVVGHVTDESDAPGAFYNLGQLRKGDRITWRAGGSRKVFRVVAKTYTPRAGKLPDRIWQQGGPRMLHLVSCARRAVFDDGGYHYTHNLTISAKLVRTS
jgi:hypothetical protein